jgi:hypothetical protein
MDGLFKVEFKKTEDGGLQVSQIRENMNDIEILGCLEILKFRILTEDNGTEEEK